MQIIALPPAPPPPYRVRVPANSLLEGSLAALVASKLNAWQCSRDNCCMGFVERVVVQIVMPLIACAALVESVVKLIFGTLLFASRLAGQDWLSNHGFALLKGSGKSIAAAANSIELSICNFFISSNHPLRTWYRSANHSIRKHPFYRLNLNAAFHVLGLPPGASPSEIKKAYHSKSKQTHPDKNNSDPKADEKFHKVQMAYKAVLDGKAFKDKGILKEERGSFIDGYSWEWIEGSPPMEVDDYEGFCAEYRGPHFTDGLSAYL